MVPLITPNTPPITAPASAPYAPPNCAPSAAPPAAPARPPLSPPRAVMAPPIPATAIPSRGSSCDTVAPSAIAPRISSGAYWLAIPSPMAVPMRPPKLLPNFCCAAPNFVMFRSRRRFCRMARIFSACLARNFPPRASIAESRFARMAFLCSWRFTYPPMVPSAFFRFGSYAACLI